MASQRAQGDNATALLHWRRKQSNLQKSIGSTFTAWCIGKWLEFSFNPKETEDVLGQIK